MPKPPVLALLIAVFVVVVGRFTRKAPVAILGFVVLVIAAIATLAARYEGPATPPGRLRL